MNVIKTSVNFIIGHTSCHLENKAVRMRQDHHQSVHSTDQTVLQDMDLTVLSLAHQLRNSSLKEKHSCTFSFQVFLNDTSVRFLNSHPSAAMAAINT